MKEADSMSAKEMDRLSDWLKSHGHTADDVLDCLKYIAQDKTPASKTPEKK
jgi:hypothetical protein|nr:MAG TPA: hypothetical protein [Caudoviricetes sp.]DAL89722.1 MAG TPA: hypothetical protein [Caudoviricetes sp.]